MKKKLFWILTPIWLPIGVALAVLAIIIGLFSLILVICMPFIALYFIGYGILICFSGIIFLFSHFISAIYFLAYGLFLAFLGTFLWRIFKLIFRLLYRDKKAKEKKKIKLFSVIIKGVICIAIMALTFLGGAKNAFYWTATGPHLAQNQSKTYYYYPDEKDNLTIYADNVNVEIVEGADFHVEYLGDDVPDFFEDEGSLTISISNSHSNPKYSITTFPTDNATLRIVEPDTTFYDSFDFEGVAKKIDISYMLTDVTTINTTNTQLSISSLLANELNINNNGGYTNLKFGFIKGDSNINSNQIYANLFQNSHYAYNLTGNNLVFQGIVETSPFSYVYSNEESLNSINLNANKVTVDLTGTFMSSSDYDEYEYIQSLPNLTSTPDPSPTN